MDEVNFIQNLVYYIERAYRTPDYGMWERGSKDNNNTRELHASSIGMAKAALEVINGLDLFGSQGSASSTIYVDPDAHNRNRMILGSLLPRESSSKETDAGLLAITGYPAFAVDDQELRSKTVERIVDKLEVCVLQLYCNHSV
jgi:phosphorylase kinase alpha/beta subunit